MDFLSHLNLFVLPEQQTRINKEISQALEVNPDIRLGFDACCYCGTKLKESNKEDVCCKVCKRVWYCSKECRRKDADCHSYNDAEGVSVGGGGGEEEQGKGHSAIICSLLKLCNIDEDVESGMRVSSGTKGIKKESRKTTVTLNEEEKKAACDRISSEYESYPATLVNVLLDAPCFEPLLDKFMIKRRSKKTRQLDLDQNLGQNDDHNLTVHVIGASEESELWGDFKLDTNTDAMDAYTEALSELFATYKGLRKVNLAFIGPNCPKKNLHCVKTVENTTGDEDNTSTDASTAASKQLESGGKKRKRDEGKKHGHQISIRTHRHNYEPQYFEKKANKTNKKGKHHHHHHHLTKPDVVIFFNPGFTCPDYDWHEALKACQRYSTNKETPFLVATNTEYEAIADLQYLHKNGYVDSLPPMVADIINEGQMDLHDNDAFSDSGDPTIFFGENNNAGSRVRQSGNMANDLYCKNKYIFGGHLNSIESKIRNSSKSKEIVLDGKGEEEEEKSSASITKEKNKRKSKSKKSNAALM